MNDPIRIHRDTVEIEGGRELYNYTFEIEPYGAERPETNPQPNNLKGNLDEPEKNSG